MQKTLLAAAGLAAAGTFGACALVLAGPVTPIKFDVGPVASLLNPHLSQNWQLFAPDPISDERGVIARIRCQGEETKWTDISSSAIARTQSSRFFPDRESRIVSNALVERFAQDDISKRLETRGKEDLVPSDVSTQRRAERVLARYAAHRIPCPSPHDPDDGPSAVQLRYVVQPLTPWSERSDGSARAEPRTTDSEWIPL
ncbi:hypothetical protein GCM10017714_31500 [Curtobacterium pusillum]|uniref:Uncharacterized protein n=1 Tax=Curtobacterium pusillum TaxID=69373 RepID=A0ABX2M8I6_9MICO|nr:DUF5819 family protein [Curtobacterium pusillum]NUU13220.1 hypothetical protein [Curtobacterium pusillum]GLK31816.1 hypothetical protein GCM10017610_21010 [Curtobacterium pusillum]